MINWIIDLDTEVFRFINSNRSNAADWFFSVLSAHFFICLVVNGLALYLMFTYFKTRWWLFVLMIMLCVFLTDRISVVCFKNVFLRLRPTHDLEGVIACKLENFQLIYTNKGGLYGFVSSHAMNVFGLSAFFIFFIKNKYLIITIAIWACLTGYSRIYCGYHYPLDVGCGASLGVIIGAFCYFLLKKTRLKNLMPKT